jgi:hypothetical protein
MDKSVFGGILLASSILSSITGEPLSRVDDTSLLQADSRIVVVPTSKKLSEVCKKPVTLAGKSAESDATAKLGNNKSAKTSSIPHHLIVTSKEDSLDKVPALEKQNIDHTLSLNPGMEVKYYSDADCASFINENFGSTCLPELFKSETHGMYRGDICRAAVLAKIGGYYTDLDLTLDVGFDAMLSHDTTFASVLNDGGRQLLNAFMASTPGNPVMTRMLTEVQKWYDGDQHLYLGTGAGHKALETLQADTCKTAQLTKLRQPTQTCGSEKIRLFSEELCGGANGACPADRMHSKWTQYGLYDEHGKVVGWSRFKECQELGCGGNGRVSSMLGNIANAEGFFAVRKSEAMHSV